MAFINSDTGNYGGIKCIYRTFDTGTESTSVHKCSNRTCFRSTTNDILNSKQNVFVEKNHGWAIFSIPFDTGYGMKTLDGGVNWTICTSS